MKPRSKRNWIPFLDYFSYKKEDALSLLQEKYEYKPYPYKHYESVFTRFYQGYILPKKFNVDKRKVHLSNLICTNKMTRNEALQKLQEIPYPSEDDLNSDIDYFLKKMNWTREDLNKYLDGPEIRHSVYKTEKPIFTWLLNLKKGYG